MKLSIAYINKISTTIILWSYGSLLFYIYLFEGVPFGVASIGLTKFLVRRVTALLRLSEEESHPAPSYKPLCSSLVSLMFIITSGLLSLTTGLTSTGLLRPLIIKPNFTYSYCSSFHFLSNLSSFLH